MKRRDFLQSALLATSALIPKTMRADRDYKPMTAEEYIAQSKTIDHCINLIRRCQLGDEYGEAAGALCMRHHRNPTNPHDVLDAIGNHRISEKMQKALDSGELKISNHNEAKKAIESGAITKDDIDTEITAVSINPYFANFAMIALAESYTKTHEFSDLERVAKWLNFFVNNQDTQTGYINDMYANTQTKQLGNFNKMDSVDSYAATFLSLARRYQQVTQGLPAEKKQILEKILPQEKLKEGCQRAFFAIATVTDEKTGRTIAKPDYKVEFLMDNVEVYAGLVDGAGFFFKAGLRKEGVEAQAHAKKLAANLSIYHQANGGYAIGCTAPNGALMPNPNRKPYPDALAHVIGLACNPHPDKARNTALFTEVTARHQPQEPFTAARIYMAADRVGDAEQKKIWRQKMLEEAKALSEADDIQRAGLSLLALTAGCEWIRSPSESKSKSR